MKENFESETGGPRKREQESTPGNHRPSGTQTNGHPNGRAATNGHTPGSPVTLWTILDLLVRRWYWLLLGTALGAGALFALGWYVVKPKFTATATLQRYESPGMSGELKPAAISAETFSALIRSPDLLHIVGEQANPPLPADVLAKCIKVEPEPDSDMVKVMMAARQPQQAVDLLNIFTREAVKYTTELQKTQAERIGNDYLKLQVESMDKDIATLVQQFRGLPASGQVTNKLSEIGGDLKSFGQNLAAPRPSSLLVAKQTERLNSALGELDELMARYTTNNPLVVRKESEIKELEGRIQQAGTNTTPGAPALAPMIARQGSTQNGFDPEVDTIRMKLLSLDQGRVTLVARQREAEAYAKNPPGNVRVFASATLNSVKSNMLQVKITLLGIFGGLVGFGVTLVLVMLAELTDNRLKTTEDVNRVTKLPVLTGLGDLNDLDPEERSQWAFRTWTMLQGRLSPSANHGLVCGITSSAEGEGRSTWVSLLAEAASLSGFRVLTIATRPSPMQAGALEDSQDNDLLLSGELDPAPTPVAGDGESTTAGQALATNILASPARVTEQLTGPNSQPVVHIPLPGWVWNLERRREWRDALNHWRTIDNLVILVELPPASVPEAVLLGSNLPNLLWLTDSGTAEAAETRAQLQTLRDARCNLVGAVINREGSPSLKKKFPRWLECIVLLLAVSVMSARAQDANTAAAPGTPEPAPVNAAPAERDATQTNLFFSIVKPAQRAAWQQHLTLGPGDVLNFGMYGQPELALAEVPIGPDGHVSFLQATVRATGLTIDELRARFDQELGNYYRSPKTIITPVAFRSKKYYMLGKVMTKGVYTLDRPLTVLEAIARAHGLENGLVDKSVIDLADFQRSFLMRGGKRIPLNFEKLFQQGDLAQNLAVEPDDYLYFAAMDIRDVYVVGEIRLPGTVIYNPDLTIIGAITARGGYTDRAYKARVLVVRGSLNNPEKFAVDTHAILDGKGLNFKLQPKDIVYVNSRPFIRVEELADLAATAFIQSLITSWVGVDIIKPQ